MRIADSGVTVVEMGCIWRARKREEDKGMYYTLNPFVINSACLWPFRTELLFDQ